MGFGEAGQTLLTIPRSVDREAGIDERFGHRDSQRGFIFDHQHT